MSSGRLMSQNEKFDLKSLDTSKYFYNAISFDNSTYFGTNQGVFVLVDGKLNLHNTALIGPIAANSGKIEAGVIKVSKKFRDLLPDDYKKSPVNAHLSSKGTLFLIAKGKLFIYEKNSYNINSVGSVRAISENYIGTYNGVIRKRDSVIILPYTNSYIREFDKASFICWDGLYVINDSIQKNYFSPTYSEVKIKENLLGRAKDIV
jgi:hypothetical protein